MNENGLKIRNIKAATLYAYNLGIRDWYDSKEAILHKSLFSLYMEKHGLNIYGEDRTRDIICLEFDFGTKSYEEEIKHLEGLLNAAADEAAKQRIQTIIDRANSHKERYEKKSKEEIRQLFYENDVTVEYDLPEGKQCITYRMLYRNTAKAKTGQVMFINEDLYEKAYDWMTMGLGAKMPKENAKIVELAAYAPLTASTIIDTVQIPVEDILILKDQDSFFRTIAEVVTSADLPLTGTTANDTSTKKCVVERKEIAVKNTIWDGMALVEADIFPDWVNGMGLLRNHFFKACGFKGYLQKFFQNWCKDKGLDYETYEVCDMFGVRHRLRDIKMITTNNAVKWLKFTELMGNTPQEAYAYWCKRINADGSVFGIVKTDHESKLGSLQQLSYQMINTLPCTKEDIQEIAKTSIQYVETLKTDNDAFETFLRQHANEINHYEMLADLYAQNHDFADSKWFRIEKSKIITNYICYLRKGKITVNADNLTICGNPYALLLYAVGEDFTKDPTLNYEQGAIQCYTTRFDDGEYLCAFRNPHNSPNNICYLHNRYSKTLQEYFPFSPNILAINCIQSDIQDRANGCDEDSDFFFVTNHSVMSAYAKTCYENFPTIVNQLKESGVTYQNTKAEYARMDNKLALSQRYIGESSNLAQLAMTYYWTYQTKELYDNFVILSVLAQIIIDGCKREYEIDAPTEIERIKNLDCMNLKKTVIKNGKEKAIRCDLPAFMKYTKEVATVKNGSELPYKEVKQKRDKINSRINPDLICPMNWLEECLDRIRTSSKTTAIDTKSFFIKKEGKPNSRQMSKIREIVENYDYFLRTNKHLLDSKDEIFQIYEETERVLIQLKKIRIGNAATMNRLIETALGIETNIGGKCYKEASKYTRKMLNLLYKMNREQFLSNFQKK